MIKYKWIIKWLNECINELKIEQTNSSQKCPKQIGH